MLDLASPLSPVPPSPPVSRLSRRVLPETPGQGQQQISKGGNGGGVTPTCGGNNGGAQSNGMYNGGKGLSCRGQHSFQVIIIF